MSLSCGTEGNNIKYYWERFNNTLPINARGANTSTLHFTSLGPENAGKYRCRVFNDSVYGFSNYGALHIHGENSLAVTVHMYAS